MLLLQHLKICLHYFNIRTVVVHPVNHSVQLLLRILLIARYTRNTNNRALPTILLSNFCNRDVELIAELCNNRFDYGTLLFERMTRVES